MVIFNSYVKLPEGIRFSDKQRHPRNVAPRVSWHPDASGSLRSQPAEPQFGHHGLTGDSAPPTSSTNEGTLWGFKAPQPRDSPTMFGFRVDWPLIIIYHGRVTFAGAGWIPVRLWIDKAVSRSNITKLIGWSCEKWLERFGTVSLG